MRRFGNSNRTSWVFDNLPSSWTYNLRLLGVNFFWIKYFFINISTDLKDFFFFITFGKTSKTQISKKVALSKHKLCAFVYNVSIERNSSKNSGSSTWKGKLCEQKQGCTITFRNSGKLLHINSKKSFWLNFCWRLVRFLTLARSHILIGLQEKYYYVWQLFLRLWGKTLSYLGKGYKFYSWCFIINLIF